ncbi:MAG TPA: hypothetical protein VMW65_01975 [Chloroflexota bacterium]|nr:hypothetical protein [Chloroflexota bacterium]
MANPTDSRASRRRVVKGAIIATGGIAGASLKPYTSPSLHLLGVPTALAWNSGPTKQRRRRRRGASPSPSP